MLLDLGAARRVIANDVQAMTVMLKPGYAPIEQYSDDPALPAGAVDRRLRDWRRSSSIAVTGKAPPASASRVMHDNVMPLSAGSYGAFSKGFLRAIDRGLALRPEERPATMAKFRSMLDDAATATLCGNDDSAGRRCRIEAEDRPGRSRPLAGHRGFSAITAVRRRHRRRPSSRLARQGGRRRHRRRPGPRGLGRLVAQ